MKLMNLAEIKARHSKFLERNDQAIRAALTIAGGEARAKVATEPGFTRRTGKVQGSTKTKVIKTRGGKLLVIENKHPAARTLESGSRAHVIRPKNGKFLRFKLGGSGGWVFARKVFHPGTKPYKFMSRSRDAASVKAHQVFYADMFRIAAKF